MMVTFTGCKSGKTRQESKEDTLQLTDIQMRLKKYARIGLKADISQLTVKEKEMLPLLFRVADLMDDIYWEQTWGDRNSLLDTMKDPVMKEFVMINYGPWDRLDNNKAFVAGIGEKPAGANFYPTDMTKEEFDAFKDPNKTSLYTLIRRGDGGKLTCVWYHEAYKAKVEEAASLLKQAAGLAEDAGLKNYLNLRAEALLTDEYQRSDFAWMEMKNNRIDLVAGPIENYEDALFGYKAAHESFILIKDLEWSKKLERFSALLPALQKGLPVDAQYKKEVPGASADMNAYDVVYYAGDCNSGSKTIAINLPNDEEVQLKYGSRKLQLKNAIKAKFETILVPISAKLLDSVQQKSIRFNAFFENIMFHEVGHGLGIKNTINGKATVRAALKEQYSAIEEAKADIMGLYLVTKLHEMGELKEGELADNYTTFFTGIFRSCRFGAASAHGKANMLQYNFFADNGVFTRDQQGIFRVDVEKMKGSVVALLQKILKIQGDGDYDAARSWIEEKGKVMPGLQADLDRLNGSDIPVDVVFDQGPDKLGL
jgi:hypothetical protein